MRILIFLFFVYSCVPCFAQELFVYTEPASNMPTKSIGFRTLNTWITSGNDNHNNYHLMPEVMVGLSKNLMFHIQAFASNSSTTSFKYEGTGLYAKYRIYSVDDVHKHFRIAGFGRVSLIKAAIDQQEIETMGQNTGVEYGFVITKLLHKVAIGSSFSLENAFKNSSRYTIPVDHPSNALNYTLSVGKLLIPKKYKSFKQLNVNAMIEILGQKLLGSNLNFLDIAPSIQFIINSQARVDLAYRKQLFSNMQRSANNSVAVKLEYTIFNFIK